MNNPYESPANSAPVPQVDPDSKYAACNKCQSVNAQLMKYTLWGGMIGPKMFTHVKCQTCGAKYNGKTGKSNLVSIILYQVISIPIVVIVVLLVLWVLR